MSRFIDSLGRHADPVLRGAGVFALVGALALGMVLCRCQQAWMRFAGSPADLGAALLALLMLWGGLALVVAGSALLRPAPCPPRPLQ
jgi:hypothetical protein